MDDRREIELKLELDPDDLARLADSPLLASDDRDDDRLVSEYFDSNDRALAAAGFTLRIRHTRDGYVQTMKQEGDRAAGLFMRPEWERPVKHGKPELDHAPFDGLVDAGRLHPLFTTDVLRSTRRLVVGDAAIEVALDRGEIAGGGRTRPLCELELELKSGDATALFAFAHLLGGVVPLTLGVQSKAERGFGLAAAELPDAYKAEPIRLDPRADSGSALAAIGASCLRQFRLNLALVVATGGVEPVHQARVALRRLRSALSSFKPILADDAGARRLAREVRWLAGLLGEVRDLDVLGPGLEPADRETLIPVRAAALRHAQTALSSARARRLMIDLAEWLAIGAWRTQIGATMPIARLAAHILDRHRRRIRRRGRHLAKLDDTKRHHVRIEAKKLRYASEFFASLWRDKKARRRHRAFLEALEDLQDGLGRLNDRVTAADLLARHHLAPPRQETGRKKLLRKASRARKHLLEPKPFWAASIGSAEE